MFCRLENNDVVQLFPQKFIASIILCNEWDLILKAGDLKRRQENIHYF